MSAFTRDPCRTDIKPVGQVVYLAPELHQRLEREQAARDDAYERFEAAEARRRRWDGIKTAAWLCVAIPTAPLVVLYAGAKLSLEFWRASK